MWFASLYIHVCIFLFTEASHQFTVNDSFSSRLHRVKIQAGIVFYNYMYIHSNLNASTITQEIVKCLINITFFLLFNAYFNSFLQTFCLILYAYVSS